MRAIHYAFAIAAMAAGTTWSDSTPLADFEARIGATSLGGYFYFFDDRADSGSSIVTTRDSATGMWDSTSFDAGAPGSEAGAKLGFAFGDKDPGCGAGCTYPPMVGMGAKFVAGGTLDITGATAITFMAKASAPVKVSFSVGISDVTQAGGDYAELLSIGTEWAKYTVALPPAAGMEQASWATPVAFNPADATALGWSISKGDNPGVSSGAFFLDDVVIENWAPQVEPVRRLGAAARARPRVSAPYATRLFPWNRARAADARGRMASGPR